MKRGALKRRTPLKRNTAKAGTNTDRRRVKTPTPLSAGRGFRAQRMTADERALADQWHRRLSRWNVCVVCLGRTYDPRRGVADLPSARVEHHHIFPKRDLYQLEQALGLARGTLVWDVRVGLVVCAGPGSNRCHEDHENARRRIPLGAIPVRAREFAVQHGLLDYLSDGVTYSHEPLSVVRRSLQQPR